MWRWIKYSLIIIFFQSSTWGYAKTSTCTVNTKNIVNFSFPKNLTKDRITSGLSGDQTAYRELYTWNAYRSITGALTCTASSSINFTSYQYIISPFGSPIQYNGKWIFPTNVNGVGVSFSENNKEIGTYSQPMVDENKSGTSVSYNSYFRTEVKIWKIPGLVGAADADGNLNFSGFKITEVVRPTNYPTDTITNISPSDLANDMPGSVTINTTTFSGTISFVPGTCNFINKTVQMGSHARSVIGNSSPWVNASFTLNCPEAWGYGMTAMMSGDTNNTIKSRSANTATKGIIVTVIPRYDIIDSARGIIGLKPGGAEGYGIQLAWGDASSLPAGDPARPVLFGQSQVVSDENFGTSGNTYVREIKMAVRYIRITGTLQPGLANSAVEILASYN